MAELHLRSWQQKIIPISPRSDTAIGAKKRLKHAIPSVVKDRNRTEGDAASVRFWLHVGKRMTKIEGKEKGAQ